jgi:glutaredoxin
MTKPIAYLELGTGNKKYKVTIIYPSGRRKTVQFGAKGYSDYTIHKDKDRMRRYEIRHRSRENWEKTGIETAGFWAKHLLWSSPSLREAIKRTSTKFNIIIKDQTKNSKRTKSNKISRSPKRATRRSPRSPKRATRRSPRSPKRATRRSPRRYSPINPRSPRRYSPINPRSPRRYNPINPRSPRRYSPRSPRSTRRYSPQNSSWNDMFKTKDWFIFTKNSCGYCNKAKEALTNKGYMFESKEITNENKDSIYSVIDVYTNNYRYFPVIFHKGVFIGGYIDLEKKLKNMT